VRHLIAVALLIVVGVPAPAADAPAEPKGQRVALTDGKLFVPDGFKPERDGIDLTLHLHGSATVVEKNFVGAGRPGVLVTVVLPGLSGVYTERFKDPKTFQRILDEARTHLAKLGVEKPAWRRVVVSSFSAGYGGVREMLKDEAAYARIDALVLADSLYAGYAGSGTERRVNPEQMSGFVRFAKAATAGEKWFILSHCLLKPDGYASTGETADFLLAAVAGKREAVEETWPGGLKLQTRYRGKQFEVYGFAGDAGPDHMRHLQNLASFWERVPKSTSRDR
jgi:hypothetical protein